MAGQRMTRRARSTPCATRPEYQSTVAQRLTRRWPRKSPTLRVHKQLSAFEPLFAPQAQISEKTVIFLARFRGDFKEGHDLSVRRCKNATGLFEHGNANHYKHLKSFHNSSIETSGNLTIRAARSWSPL